MAGRPAAPININLVVLPAAQLAGIDVTPHELYAVVKQAWMVAVAGPTPLDQKQRKLQNMQVPN